MASDNLNEIGKYVKGTRRGVDFALKRYHPSVPKVERIRDIFDSEIPFEMSFNTDRKGAKITLDLNFNKPPPALECKTDCIATGCQTFNLSAGSHLVTLDRAYTPHTVSVFINAIPLLPEQVEEVSPQNGTVFIQSTSVDPYAATVCYSYGIENCPEEDCPAVDSGAYTGLSVIFSDRFDKSTVDINTSKGCGQWGLDDTPNISIRGDGTAFVDEIAYLDQFSVAGSHWEMLFQFKLLSSSDTARVDLSSGQEVSFNKNFIISGLSGGSTRTLTINSTCEFWINDGISRVEWFEQAASASVAIPSTQVIEYYARFVQYIPTGWFLKVWEVGEEEPASWTLSLNTLPTPDTGGSGDEFATDQQWIFSDLASADVSFSALRNITIWGDANRGRWTTRGGGLGYSLENCYTNPDGELRFGHCDPTSSSVSFAQNLFDLDESTPSCFLNMSWPFFSPGPGANASHNQTSRGYTVSDKVGLVTIKGQIVAVGNVNWNGISVGVTFYQHSFTGAPSPGVMLPGSAVGSVVLQINSPTWTDFEVSMYPINGEIQWSMQFNNLLNIVNGLIKPDTGFTFPPTAGIGVSARNVQTYADGLLLCTTDPYCPDNEESILGRCGNATDSFSNVPTTSFHCGLGNNVSLSSSFFYTNDSNQRVHIVQEVGAAVQSIGGAARVSYRARGLSTTNGVGGRCRREITAATYAAEGTSSTEAQASFRMPSAIACEGSGETYFEFRIPFAPPPSWITDQAGMRIPIFYMYFGDVYGFSGAQYQLEMDGSGNSKMNSSGITPTSGTFVDVPISVGPGTWYSLRYKAGSDTSVMFKIWPTGSTEPGWFTTGTSNNGIQTSFSITLSYAEFKDDNFYVDIRSYSATGMA